jgi:serine/threonine protein kinase/tetratricopeptide (TPR) repeat protein
MSPERWLRIEAVFQEAADLPASERAAFLDRECGADAELRAEVQNLLESDDAADNFIEVPVWTDSRFLSTKAKKEISKSFDVVDRDNYLGRRIGAYKLVKELGRGGMGAVYLAERADGEFQQRVAVKLIKRGMDSDFIIKRFRHERQILASFEHPFIARLLDGGRTDDDVPYFVMEYIVGETLYNYCDKKRLSTRDRLKVFQKVCSAIQYAHERQIVHRDIKPSNILIDRLGTPKLLDFGIAKILDPDLIHESINPTASMLRMMTPDYASPEQIQGVDVTPASDTYSLGVLLYELITGHRPYNFGGRSLHEISKVVCEVMPELPSKILNSEDNLLPAYAGAGTRYLYTRSTTLNELRDELVAGIDDIVMKAVAKDPADRYESVDAFSRDISRFLRGVQVEAPRFSRTPRTREDVFLHAPANSKALAVLPLKFMNLGGGEDTDDRFLGLGLADALITRLSKVRRFVVRPTSSIISFGDAIDPVRAGRELNVDYILDGNIKKAGKRLRVTVQLLNVAENAAVWATSIDETLSDVLTLEDTLANKVIEVLLPQLTGSELEEFAKRGTEVPEAFEHYLRGRYHFNSYTEEGLAKAFVSFHSAIAADPKYAHAYAGIADYYNWLGIIGVLPPQECFQPAIDAASKAVELDENLSEAHASLGFSLHAGEYDWSRAETHLRKAMELNPSNASAYVWYSIVLYTEGRFQEGLDFARRGIELDPLTPFNHHNIGWGLYFARRYDEAAAQYRRVIEQFPSYTFGYYGLSKVHRISGNTEAAIRENERSSELMSDSVFSLLAEAECYAADGQRDEALARVAKLEALAKERYVSPYQLALVYCYLKDRPRALELLENAAEIKEAWLNYLGIEPVFDVLRDDERFDAILEKVGYRMFFNSFAVSGTDLHHRETVIQRAKGEVGRMHDLTTLVIPETDKTDDGIPVEPRRASRAWIYAATAAVLLVLLGVGIYFVTSGGSANAPASTVPVGLRELSIVVAPFTSDEETNKMLGVGLADALSSKLGGIKRLQVLSANTGRSIASEDPLEAARKLEIAYLVRGSMSKGAGGQASLDARLVRVSDGSAVWQESFTAEDGDLYGIQNRLAEKIWTSLGIDPLPMERQQLEKTFAGAGRAYDAYLLGRYQMTNRSKDNLRKAVESFEAASKADPGFALAYVGISDAYSLLNLYDVYPPVDAYPKAEENARKALAIDDNLAEAHASLAYIKFYYRRDHSGAELEFRRAIQLNPSYGQAHHWFALALAYLNRPVEAISEAETAQRLDPRSPSIKAATAIVYFMNGRMEEALAECDKALAIDPTFVPAFKVKRWTYSYLNDPTNADAVFTKEMEYSGGHREDPGWKIIALQFAPTTDREKLVAEIGEVAGTTTIRNNPFAFAYEVALSYAHAGEPHLAIEWLARAEEANSHSFHSLAVDPRLAGLAGHPAFEKLAAILR